MITSSDTCFERISEADTFPCTIFLTNGIKLNGHITEVLGDGVVLTRDGSSQLIFRHAMATIMPAAESNLALGS